MNPLEGDEKIVVVSHSCLISSLFASGYIGEGGQSKLVDYVWPVNCEVLPIDI